MNHHAFEIAAGESCEGFLGGIRRQHLDAREGTIPLLEVGEVKLVDEVPFAVTWNAVGEVGTTMSSGINTGFGVCSGGLLEIACESDCCTPALRALAGWL